MSVQMKSLFLTAIVAVFAARLAQCGERQLEITISINGASTEKAGSPVAVSITLINQSDKTLSVSLLDFADDYTVDVTDAQSAPAPDSQDVRKARREMDACRNLGKAVCGQKWGHGVIGQVKPGETWSERLLITKYHDMSRPGKYTIQLERKLPEELGPGTVKSNPITITMTE